VTGKEKERFLLVINQTQITKKKKKPFKNPMPRYTNKSKQQTHIQISRNKKKKQDSCNHTCKKQTQKEKGGEKKNAYKKGGERER